jgi:hypothetical protein
MMYTSGCPKNQNRCCQRRASRLQRDCRTASQRVCQLEHDARRRTDDMANMT